MNNYEFCASFATSHLVSGARVLDYGCGGGLIVKLLRERGLDAVGCDIFYEGGNHLSGIRPEELAATIFPMEGDKIPFPDNCFELVINNQVLEHVVDLGAVVSEMTRVLKPGGTVLSIFPDSGVWREGHCGVPFLHWFPKGSRFRVNYAYLARLLGAGYCKKNKPPRQWAEDFCVWLDMWTYYRPYAEIEAIFSRHLSKPRHLESYYMEARIGLRAGLIHPTISSLIVRKLGGVVFEVQKADTQATPRSN